MLRTARWVARSEGMHWICWFTIVISVRLSGYRYTVSSCVYRPCRHCLYSQLCGCVDLTNTAHLRSSTSLITDHWSIYSNSIYNVDQRSRHWWFQNKSNGCLLRVLWTNGSEAPLTRHTLQSFSCSVGETYSTQSMSSSHIQAINLQYMQWFMILKSKPKQALFSTYTKHAKLCVLFKVSFVQKISLHRHSAKH